MARKSKLPRPNALRDLALVCEALETRTTVSDVVISTLTLPFLASASQAKMHDLSPLDELQISRSDRPSYPSSPKDATETAEEGTGDTLPIRDNADFHATVNGRPSGIEIVGFNLDVAGGLQNAKDDRVTAQQTTIAGQADLTQDESLISPFASSASASTRLHFDGDSQSTPIIHIVRPPQSLAKEAPVSPGVRPPDAGDNGTRVPGVCAIPPLTPPCDDSTCPDSSCGVGGIGSGGGGSIGIASDLVDRGAYDRNFSAAGVRYADGMAWVRNSFIPAGNGFGSPWGSGIYWNNLSCQPITGTPETAHSELPYLAEVGGGTDMYVISNGLNYRRFGGKDGSGVFQTGRFYLHLKEKFYHNAQNQEFLLNTTTGEQFRWHDFTVTPDYSRGQLKSVSVR